MGKNLRVKTNIKNIENVCRLCLRTGARISIWDSSHKYLYQIRSFCRVRLQKNDGLPKVICSECSATLTAMGYLREKSRQTDNYLRGKFDVLNDKTAIDSLDIKKDLDENYIKLKNEPDIKEEINDVDPIENVECHLQNLSDQEDISYPCSPLEDSASKNVPENKINMMKRKGREKNKILKCKKKSKNYEKQKINGRSKCLCPICGKFLYISGYNKHIELHGFKDNNIHKRFGCTKCNNSFYSAERLKRHMEYHSLEKTYPCSICDKKFKTQHDANRHTKLIHQRYQATECMICHKILNSKSSYMSHLATHTGKKQYECDICNQKFSARCSLINHIRLHTGERPHKCHICNSSFRVQKSLIEHIRLHTGEKPHKCPACDKGFAQKGNMKSHFRYNHKDKVFQ